MALGAARERVVIMSRIIDKGNDVMDVYPEVETYNSRGEKMKRPADTPVRVRFTSSEDRSSKAELPGQVAIKVVRGIARDAPVGQWARVVYSGEEWDIASPPRFTPGMSRALRHVEFTLRSRNGAKAVRP